MATNEAATDAAASARLAALDLHPAYYAALAEDARQKAAALPPQRPLIERTQALARALLMLLNTRPIAAIQTGGLANARNEKTSRAAARAADDATAPALAGPAKLALQDTLWALLDIGALNIILDEDFEADEVPGTLDNDSADLRAAYTISRHLKLLRGAYPHACIRADIGSLQSVMRLLTGRDINTTRTTAIDTAVAVVGGGRAAATAMHDRLRPQPAAAGGKRKRQGGGGGPQKKPRWDRADEDWTGGRR